jgi:hypothetical protein
MCDSNTRSPCVNGGPVCLHLRPFTASRPSCDVHLSLLVNHSRATLPPLPEPCHSRPNAHASSRYKPCIHTLSVSTTYHTNIDSNLSPHPPTSNHASHEYHDSHPRLHRPRQKARQASSRFPARDTPRSHRYLLWRLVQRHTLDHVGRAQRLSRASKDQEH